MTTRIGLSASILAFVIVLAGVPAAHAVDGQILITQAKALAGGVTPGDAAGFPVTISQPGSYRLSSNLTVPDANTTAIEIQASNVTLDLNGFAILGPTVCSGFPVSSCAPKGFGSGITTTSPLSGIAVRNGTVRGMGLRGIFLDGGGHQVEWLRAESNGDVGINAQGSTMSHNTATINGSQGLVGTGMVSHNTVTFNGAEGIFAQGVVSHNTAKNNKGAGIAVFTGSLVNHNTMIDNNGFGLSLELGAGYTGNVIRGNASGTVTGSGVSIGGGNHNLCNGVPC